MLISHEAVALIRLRGGAIPKGCRFLFPGDVPGQPVVDLKRFWERMRASRHPRRPYPRPAPNLCLTAGFWWGLAEMIGRLLGDTQIGTAQRYAHLIDSPLRAGVNAVGEMLRPRLRVVGGVTQNVRA